MPESINQKPVTVAAVRKMANKYACDFHKGHGYYYFTGFNFYDSMVCVARVDSLTIDMWERELQQKISKL